MAKVSEHRARSFDGEEHALPVEGAEVIDTSEDDGYVLLTYGRCGGRLVERGGRDVG